MSPHVYWANNDYGAISELHGMVQGELEQVSYPRAPWAELLYVLSGASKTSHTSWFGSNFTGKGQALTDPRRIGRNGETI